MSPKWSSKPVYSYTLAKTYHLMLSTRLTLSITYTIDLMTFDLCLILEVAGDWIATISIYWLQKIRRTKSFLRKLVTEHTL